MKKIILLLTLTISTLAFSQKEGATIILRNGEQKSGLIKITNSGKLKLYKNKNSKGQIIETRKIVEVISKKNPEKKLYSIQVDSIGTYKLLKLVTKGIVSLYKVELRSSMYNGGDTYDKLFVIRSGKNFATHIGNNIIYKNKAKKYFKDCNNLLTKMDDRKFRKQSAKIIIDYYNENCND
jgi:hypothetical protein